MDLAPQEVLEEAQKRWENSTGEENLKVANQEAWNILGIQGGLFLLDCVFIVVLVVLSSIFSPAQAAGSMRELEIVFLPEKDVRMLPIHVVRPDSKDHRKFARYLALESVLRKKGLRPSFDSWMDFPGWCRIEIVPGGYQVQGEIEGGTGVISHEKLTPSFLPDAKTTLQTIETFFNRHYRPSFLKPVPNVRKIQT